MGSVPGCDWCVDLFHSEVTLAAHISVFILTVFWECGEKQRLQAPLWGALRTGCVYSKHTGRGIAKVTYECLCVGVGAFVTVLL